MATVVLHFEFKRKGAVGTSGPGDTLRLAHALAHPVFADKRLIVLTASPFAQLGELISREAEFKCIKSQGGSGDPSGRFYPLRAQEIIEAEIPAATPISRIVHAFVGYERGRPIACGELKVHGNDVRRFRIDGSTPSRSCMFHDRWKERFQNTCRSKTLAATIREGNAKCRLNTPSWFCGVVRTVARELGWNILWAGAKDKWPTAVGQLEANEDFFPFNALTCLQQLAHIAKHATAGVGWNSGGLDLIAAAGVPILRGGEFQRRSWGKRYNSYLATKLNLGLEPKNRARAEMFSPGLFERALRWFLEQIEQSKSPAHVILPEDMLSQNIGARIPESEVTWKQKAEPPSWWS